MSRRGISLNEALAHSEEARANHDLMVAQGFALRSGNIRERNGLHELRLTWMHRTPGLTLTVRGTFIVAEAAR